MTTYQWLCILGVQAFVTTSVSIIIGIINNTIQKRIEKKQASQEDMDLMKQAMQVALRKDLFDMYQIAVINQSVTVDEQKLFLDMYDKYHALWENGVMSSVKEQYMKIKVIN